MAKTDKQSDINVVPQMRVVFLTPTDVNKICNELDIRPTKQLGQNFVTDAQTVRKIVNASAISDKDNVLEIGPGLGSLTLGILESGAHVCCVELDPKLANLLPKTLQKMSNVADKAVVLYGDGMKITPADIKTALEQDKTAEQAHALQYFASPNVLVANLPYNVAVPIIIHILEVLPSIKKVLVMVQKEVADRICASSSNRLYGIPSAKIAWWGTASGAGKISRNIFYPVPNVDSALVKIECQERFDQSLRTETFTLIDTAFASRRKMLRATLKKWASDGLQTNADCLQKIFAISGIDGQKRPEELTIDDFYALVQAKHTLQANNDLG